MRSEPNPTEEIAKFQCLHALFGDRDTYGPDLARHLKSAIDFSLTGSDVAPAPLDQFAEAAERLRAKQNPETSGSFALQHLDLRSRTYEPLWVRAELIEHMKQLAGYSRALLLISGLRESFPHGRQQLKRRQKEYQEAISLIEDLAREWSTPHAHLTILHA